MLFKHKTQTARVKGSHEKVITTKLIKKIKMSFKFQSLVLPMFQISAILCTSYQILRYLTPSRSYKIGNNSATIR